MTLNDHFAYMPHMCISFPYTAVADTKAKLSFCFFRIFLLYLYCTISDNK